MLKKLLPSLLVCSYAYSYDAQMKPVSETPDGKVNYPSNFQVEEGWNLLTFGEYLYWTANEDGLYFAQTGLQAQNGSVPPDGSINFNGKLQKIDPEWSSGMRIGAGLNFPKEGYDAVICWTWFATEGKKSAQSHYVSLLPLWAQPDFTPFNAAIRAVGKWELDMNVLDLEWGRSSWMGAHFSFRPFFGIRGALIDQSLKVNYTYATSPVVFEHLHADADFRGGGLRAGFKARFVLPCDFALYGFASGSLLYGQINSDLKVKENTQTIAHTRDLFNKGISSLQLGFGTGWDTHFSKDRFHIEFHIGWESNQWFSINTMNHFMNQLYSGNYFKENGNLSTQGVVAGGRFDF